MSRTMKDSGIPWIGEIPEEWKIGKVKNFYRFITGFTPDTKNDEYYDNENGTPWATISDLSSKYVESTKSGISELYISLKHPTIIPINSLLYSFKLSVGQVAKTKIELYTNEAIAAFLPTENISLDYLYYSSQICIIENANENIYGAKLLNQDLIYNSVIVFPPLAEQHLIATFLDKKCSEIDSLIDLQEQMIEELKAYKQSVITEAVTKGIRNEELGVRNYKDSGIDWIDTIPNHWIVRKMKSLIDLKSGSNLTSEQISDKDDGYPVYGGNGLRGTYSEYSNEGDYVLVGRQGALCGNINYASGKFWVTEHALVCYPKEALDIRWLGESLRAMNLNQYSLSAAQPGLSAERIKNLYMIVPPLAEQQAIADYLDEKCADIDSLIQTKLSKIESLKEYKKSVIYEYVTGKREV